MKFFLRGVLFFAVNVFGTAFAVKMPVHQYKLSNGLLLIVKEDHRAPVVFSSVWYKVGGSYEHNGITGISHVLEHMMFRGTYKYGPGEFNRQISAAGGQQNAMTSDDFTAYFQFLPAGKLELGFMLEADRMRNLNTQKEIFSKEIQVVMEEGRMQNALTWERLRVAAFANNPCCHPTVGWMTDLKHMTLADVDRWYSAWYHPNNAVVVVVGDVDPQEVFSLAKRYFAPLPRHPLPKLKSVTEMPNLVPNRVSVILSTGVPALFVGFAVPVINSTVKPWEPYALAVLSKILGGSASGRLQNHLLRGQEIVSSIFSSYNPFSLRSTLLEIYAVPSAGVSCSRVLKSITNILQTLKEKAIAPEELARIKALVISRKVYSLDSVMSQALELGALLAVGLPWQLSEDYINNISKVTPAQVREVAQKYLLQQNTTLADLNYQQHEIRE